VGGKWGIRGLKVARAMKGSHLDRMCRFINGFWKDRDGILKKKILKKVRAKPVSV
jgi:hypothetical protein